MRLWPKKARKRERGGRKGVEREGGEGKKKRERRKRGKTNTFSQEVFST